VLVPPFYFAGRINWDLVEDDYLVRRLVTDTRMRELDQFRHGRPGDTRPPTDVSTHVFAVERVVHADYASALDGLVLEKRFFDFLSSSWICEVAGDRRLPVHFGW